MLKPKVIIVSLLNGEPAVGTYLALRLVRVKVVFDVRDEWEDYVIGKSSQKTFQRSLQVA